ncbi:gliding motility-associated C-terminal domain-containing protein [Hymenobacter sp. RP-2-7]|uniref:Gliding motility-associated C-terminal domain-containing protein n=1 Tax=Hymenobacter polaris TaxID=2682546 RepID=A0A7Y0FNK1_9BACT|nr:gliding motility-associated C-terminal domain-containing protein [Hymenobacter polaris]NML66554.1 gliding motility-associated C-terminal domain-containing protein [Hymenobacter polaris]
MLALSAWAQAPTKVWDRTLGGSNADFPYAIAATTDGGSVVGGYSYSGASGDKTQDINGNNDYWVVKLDASGKKQWDKTYGGNDYDVLRSLQQTKDGGYILGGFAYSSRSGSVSEASKGGADYWIVKLDANGNKQWDRRIGGNDHDLLYALQQTADGGYILGGSSFSKISGDKSANPYGFSGADGWVVKLDANGRKEWDRTLGGTNADELRSIEQTADGGYLAGFSTASPVSGDKTKPSKGGYLDYWVVKLDAQGQVQWDQVVGGPGLDYFVTAHQTRDGGYILGGHTDSEVGGDKTQPNRGGIDYWVVKLDAQGQRQWDQRVGTTVGDTLGGLCQTSDGGYLLGGKTRGGIGGDKTQARRGGYDYWVVKLDASGKQQWDGAFGGTGSEELVSLQQLADGNYLLAGASYSGAGADKSEASRGNADYWVVKITSGAQLAIQGEQVLCPGGAVVLTAVPIPAAATYQWSTGATTPTLRVTQPGTYSVVVTFADGQTRTAQHQVTAFAASLTIAGDSVLCAAGTPLTLAATTTGASAYQWSTGTTTPTIAVSQPGLYTVVATYPSGCTAQARLRVLASPVLPAFSLGADTTLCEGAQLLLRAPTLRGVTYRWSDGSAGATLAVQQAGSYSLTVASACTSQTATRRIATKSCLLLPNIITPNGDGLNDRFRVAGLVGTGWQLLVYNRWGQQVYQAADYRHEWGEQAAPGLYYYHLRQATTNTAYQGWVEVRP